MDGTVPSSRRTSAEVCAESALPPAQSPPPIDHLEIMETHISEARSISSKNGSKSSRQGSCHEQEANLPMGFRRRCFIAQSRNFFIEVKVVMFRELIEKLFQCSSLSWHTFLEGIF